MKIWFIGININKFHSKCKINNNLSYSIFKLNPHDILKLNLWLTAPDRTKRSRNITHRLKIHTTLTSELTTMLTGHGRLKAYYHRIKIIEDPTCACGGGRQTAHHLLYDCKLCKERLQLSTIVYWR